ncbi:OmpA family protein [Mucilaginibacter agri]|uniref:OmpA family protein n=1 Tax=Mucilaginibacter agri TaxID=2695265 RepID=A0A965ZLY5_9SPHI|nr:OmpA family protein [Mucilaginibacter agri]NCD72374.1 OmpA family protein [Mucilaginibacter agri]
MLKRYIIILALSLAPLLLFAQESSTLKSARKEYLALQYKPAIVLLERELKDHPDDKEAQEMIADSYRKTKNYDKAIYWYAEITRRPDMKSQWALYYAEALANKQRYEASEVWYRKYLQLVTKDDRASAFIESYPQVGVFLKNRKAWTISYLNINTAASEYSPLYYKQGLIFTANRKFKGMVKRVFEWEQSPFTDLYYVDNLSDIKPVNADSLTIALRQNYKEMGQKKYRGNVDDTAPTPNDSKVLGTYDINLLKDTLGNYLSTQLKVERLPGKINTKYHEGSAALLPDGSVMFTRNNYLNGKYGKSKSGIHKLKIYTAKAPDWTTIESFPYNNDQYSTGHPALNKEGTLLIFSSDMPGGFGGVDLYYSKRASVNDVWEKPVNMGPVINTEGNEVFPTIYRDSILLFSSTGHAGLGGLDIFQVALKGVEPLHTPINLGAPLNSSVDDFGIIRSDEGSTGYFSSNRRGNDDIYSFTFRPFDIKILGSVVDSASNQPILNALVTTDPAIDLKKDSVGRFGGPLKGETVYHITATAPGYNTVSDQVSTRGIDVDTTLFITLRPRRIILPFNCDSLKQKLTLENVYYTFNKSYIRTDAREILNRLIGFLKDQPELSVLIASYCDSRGSSAYNLDLSQRRSRAARAYLTAHGISSNRIQIEYFGESNLVNNCTNGVPCSPAAQQLNRRSEFFLLKDGKKILTMECDWLKQEFMLKP